MRAVSSGVVCLALIASGCGPDREEIVLHRSNCEVCHLPLNEDGAPQGIEEAHPWFTLQCTDCHGGNAWVCTNGEPIQTVDGYACPDGELVYDQELAHILPGTSPRFLKNLSSKDLDEVDQDYLRFVNPGDFRVAYFTCGGGSTRGDGSGGGCHQPSVDAVVKSTMAHTTGEVTVARYRAMAQDTTLGLFGAMTVIDPDYSEDLVCASELIDQYNPTPVDPLSDDPANGPTVANAQDQYMVKSCFRCHLNDFGENRFEGDYRSSGCTACHMPYANDGISRSRDPWVNKLSVPHPVTHQLTKAPPTPVCTHCHYRGGRIGIGFQGYRESAGAGLNPEHREVLGEGLHGHDANYYITDEDTRNDWDETPPDLHFEAGMHCVDCHTKRDVHGDGHLYADTQCAVASECTDCHGTVRAKAAPDPTRNNLFEKDGKLFLETKVGGKVLEVRQTIDVVTKGSPWYSEKAEHSMGVNAGGFSHTDELECYTCHASWLPSCYGCHVTVDFTKDKDYHTTGLTTAGKPKGERRWIQLNDLVLLRNTDGLLAPSMPAERFFMTAEVPDIAAGHTEENPVKKTLYSWKPRTFVFPDGRKIAGFGQRAFNPHTTRRRSAFMACDRCHSVGSVDKPENKVLLDITHGFGSERFPQPACDVSNDDDSCGPGDQVTYQLDRLMTDDGKPLVVVGHPDPHESRVLSLKEVEAMRKVLVPQNPPYSTAIPPNAKTDPTWPAAQRVDP